MKPGFCISPQQDEIICRHFDLIIMTEALGEVESDGIKFTPFLVFCYFLVGILWGCTNPFIKNAQEKHNNKSLLPSSTNNNANVESKTYINTIKKFVTDPFMFLPFLLNQSGSFFYYFIISSQPISVASPICNSLAFMFTAMTGYCYFKEELHSLSLLLIGVCFVLTGSFVCISS